MRDMLHSEVTDREFSGKKFDLRNSILPLSLPSFLIFDSFGRLGWYVSGPDLNRVAPAENVGYCVRHNVLMGLHESALNGLFRNCFLI